MGMKIVLGGLPDVLGGLTLGAIRGTNPVA